MARQSVDIGVQVMTGPAIVFANRSVKLMITLEKYMH